MLNYAIDLVTFAISKVILTCVSLIIGISTKLISLTFPAIIICLRTYFARYYNHRGFQESLLFVNIYVRIVIEIYKLVWLSQYANVVEISIISQQIGIQFYSLIGNERDS